MNDRPIPDPAVVDRAVQRGRRRLHSALQPDAGPLNEPERRCLRGILAAIDSAAVTAAEVPPGHNPHPWSAGVLAYTLDVVRAELAELAGGAR